MNQIKQVNNTASSPHNAEVSAGKEGSALHQRFGLMYALAEIIATVLFIVSSWLEHLTLHEVPLHLILH